MSAEFRPSLLLVHRTPGTHNHIVAYLRAAGVACAEAKSAEEALAVLSALRFDFVLVDPPSPELEQQLRTAYPAVRSIAAAAMATEGDTDVAQGLEPASVLRQLR